MCMDMDTATDLDTFILIRPCSDLCHTIRVDRWACPLFRHFSCLLPPFFPAGGKKVPKISKITREEMEQLIELVCKRVPLYDQSSCDYN